MNKNELVLSEGKSILFGDCVVSQILDSKNPEWKVIKLQQETTTLYNGNREGSNFKLNSLLGGDVPLEYKDTRRNTTSVRTSVVDQLTEGQIIPGLFINRITHDSPQWDTHEVAANGKYYTTIAETEAKADRAAVVTVKEAAKVDANIRILETNPVS